MFINYEGYALDDRFLHCLFCHLEDRKGRNGNPIL